MVLLGISRNLAEKPARLLYCVPIIMEIMAGAAAYSIIYHMQVALEISQFYNSNSYFTMLSTNAYSFVLHIHTKKKYFPFDLRFDVSVQNLIPRKNVNKMKMNFSFYLYSNAKANL